MKLNKRIPEQVFTRDILETFGEYPVGYDNHELLTEATVTADRQKLVQSMVLVRDPRGKRPPCYLSSTDLSLTPRAIIERFALRWTIEQMFSDAKLLLGLDSAEVRAEHSVVRHASITFALLAWVRVWAAQRLATLKHPPTSFAAQLTELRGSLMAHTIFMSNLGRKLSPRNVDSLARLAVAS